MRESTLMEKERTAEPVSAVERERTMRNLVDMQKKVEQRQQRDRERQLLRVSGDCWHDFTYFGEVDRGALSER